MDWLIITSWIEMAHHLVMAQRGIKIMGSFGKGFFM
jgi:hypothetical protein